MLFRVFTKSEMFKEKLLALDVFRDDPEEIYYLCKEDENYTGDTNFIFDCEENCLYSLDEFYNMFLEV